MRGLIAGLITVGVSITVGAAALPAQSERPRLVVLLIFDQMRGDYLQRWNDLFTPDGFRRLKRDGTGFTNCHYPYAGTTTGPGHASLATGCSPDRHGIIGNEWFDRASGGVVNCGGTARYATVYSTPPPADPGVKPEEYGGSPDRLLVPTFADALKDATGGRAKVVALALKDRSAILPGGRKPDACCWFNDRTGSFCTSTYYRDRPPAWVNEFNAPRPADRWFARPWDRLRGDLDYARHSGPDDVPGEGTGVVRKQGRVFPHPMNAGLQRPGKDYFDTLETSPFGNELLLDFALKAIEAEGLGLDETPDFLSLGFSSNDLVGHQYGPDSQEVLDVTLRSDLIVRNLLTALDQKVGKGRYVVAVSADHGICPIPEVSAAKGVPAQRVHPKGITAAATAFLKQTYGPVGENLIQNQSLPWYYLNHGIMAANGLAPNAVAETLAGFLRQQPSIQAVYTRQQLDAGIPAADVVGQRARKSQHSDRAGDLQIVSKPYYLITTYSDGTSHGTPHPYDTHVPLIVSGCNTPVGSSDEAVTPQAVVAALAHAAGIPVPAGCEAPLPKALQSK